MRCVILIYRHYCLFSAPKNFFIQNKYFWPPLEAIEKLCPDACEITNSVRSLPGIRWVKWINITINELCSWKIYPFLCVCAILILNFLKLECDWCNLDLFSPMSQYFLLTWFCEHSCFSHIQTKFVSNFSQSLTMCAIRRKRVFLLTIMTSYCRTHLGKGRAWLRLALMQKKLADYFKVFIENREILKYVDAKLT